MNRNVEDPTAPALLALREATRRAARGGVPRSLLLLHLSAIAAPRPHHAQVARAILTDVAERLEGEVLRLPHGDLALLCRSGRGAPDQIGPHATGPDGLPAVLEKLFATAALGDRNLFTTLRLPEQGDRLHSELFQSPKTHAPPPPTTTPAVTQALLHAATSPGLDTPLSRQMAARLSAAAGLRTIEPRFCDIAIALEVLEARVGAAGQARADPFLCRHLCAELDAAVLAAVSRQIDSGPAPGIAVHLNLTPSGVLSKTFDLLVALCRARATQLGVVLSFVDAVAARENFAQARARLRDAGALLVLGGVSAAALPLTRPGAIGADLIKLDWTSTLPLLAAEPAQTLRDAITAIGPARLVLHGADTEAAIAWGREVGVTLFQGRHIDAMLAARRISASTDSSLSALRDGIDHAAALGPSKPPSFAPAAHA